MVFKLPHDGQVAYADLKIGKSRKAMHVLNDANGLYTVNALVIAEPLQ
jgi:hypothetical protein